MKKLICEMCGGNELVKEDGLFVCQSCGSRYSVEEAKKMMIEGNVDVSGSTVKVDKTESIGNYLIMAENAYEADNKQEAETYCNKIIEIEPTNYQAWLLKGRAAGWQSSIANLRIEEAVHCFSNAIENAPEDKLEEVKKTAVDEVSNLTMALMKMSCDNFAQLPSKTNAENILNAVIIMRKTTIDLLLKCGASATDTTIQMATMINNSAMDAWNNVIYSEYCGPEGHPSVYDLATLFERVSYCRALLEEAIDLSDDDDQADIQRYKNLISITTTEMNSFSYTISSGGWVKDRTLDDNEKQKRIDMIMGWHQKIKEIDPNYQIPSRPRPQSGACYVATAVYGSYDCPQVWTLRRYRDYKLAGTWYGRTFIRIYYAISPTLVKYFGDTEGFKRICKGRLDKMTNKLQEKGYLNTPYEDKEW